MGGKGRESEACSVREERRGRGKTREVWKGSVCPLFFWVRVSILRRWFECGKRGDGVFGLGEWFFVGRFFSLLGVSFL